jgi:RimJ/RimL family protein N-acetyltransferase
MRLLAMAIRALSNAYGKALDIVIRTQRLLLRLPRAEDVEDIHRIFGDPRVMTYWSGPAHKDVHQTAEWLAPILDDPAGSALDYFIEFEGRLVGKLGCWRVPEIGFILAKDYWGRGIAREALTGFIAHVQAMGLSDHLFADVDPRNQRSKALLEACGFLKTGSERNTLHTHIGWCDSDYYRLDL